jgi:hypothetical protein
MKEENVVHGEAYAEEFSAEMAEEVAAAIEAAETTKSMTSTAEIPLCAMAGRSPAGQFA